MKEYALLLILAAITDNMLLVHALGTDWLTLIRREDRSLPTAFWLLLGINTLTSLAAYFLRDIVSGKSMAVAVYTVICAALIGVAALIFSRSNKSGQARVLLQLVAVDASVPALMFITAGCASVTKAVVTAVGATAGLAIAFTAVICISERLKSSQPPSSFKGAPLLVASMAIIAVALTGFEGLGA